MIRTRAITINLRDRLVVAALAEQLEQDHEEVDEIKVKRQRAEHSLLPRDFAGVGFKIHLLDALCVVGSEAYEHDDADDRDSELKRARPEEDIDEGRDHDTDQTHHEERSKARKIGSGRVAVEAHRAEGRRRDEERTSN